MYGFVVGPIVRALVASHIRGRLDLLRHAVLVSGLGNETQDQLVAAIDRLMPLWPTKGLFSRVITVFYAFVLPVGGPIVVALKAVGV